jgi:hypothetical protein
MKALKYKPNGRRNIGCPKKVEEPTSPWVKEQALHLTI